MIMVMFFHPVGLTENCRGCATQSLQYLKDLKTKTTLQRADPASIRIVVQKILHLGQVRYTQYLRILCPFRTLCCLWIQRLNDFQCVIFRCLEFYRHAGVWFLPICVLIVYFFVCLQQELRPKGMDVRQEELGDLVDKEMAATSAAIEEAVRRIDVSALNQRHCNNRYNIQQARTVVSASVFRKWWIRREKIQQE